METDFITGIKFELINGNTPNEWCFYFICDSKESASELYFKLDKGDFEASLFLKDDSVKVIIHFREAGEILTKEIPLATVQYKLLRDKVITHFSTAYWNNDQLIANHSLVPAVLDFHI